MADAQTNIVPVYDPDSNSLRAAPAAVAKQLREEGYVTGAEAQAVAIRQSLPYKAAGFFAKAGEAGSAGLSDLANLALGQKRGLREQQTFEQEHPVYSGLGSALGYAASFAGGPASLGSETAAKISARTAFPGITSLLTHTALPGAGAAAAEGAAQEYTRQKVLQDPVNLEAIAASAFSHVVWNSAGNAVGFGVGKLPGALRSGSGDILDWLERKGWHQPVYEKVPPPEQIGPQLQNFRLSGEHTVEDVAQNSSLHRAESIDDVKEALAYKDMLKGSMKRVDSAAEEGASKATNTTRETVSKTRAQAAPEAGATLERVPDDASPDDFRANFEWPEELDLNQRKHIVRRLIKERLNEKPAQLDLWNESTLSEAQIQRIKELVKSGELSPAEGDLKLIPLMREREVTKSLLAREVPSEIRDGQYVPGFGVLNDEYARLSGNPYKDLQEPRITAGAGAADSMPRAKAPTERVSSATSNSTIDTDKYKRAFSEQTGAEASRTESGSASARDYDKTVAEERASDTSKSKNSFKYQFTFKPPKVPPGKIKVGVKARKSPVDLGQASLAAGFIPGAKYVAGPYVAAETALHVSAGLANARGPIGNVVGALGKKTERYLTPAIRTATASLSSRGQQSGRDAVNPQDYLRATSVLSAAAANPGQIQAYMQQAYPQLHETNPEAAAAITTTLVRAVTTLNQVVPKRPYAPTLRDTNFKPPRAQQVKALTRWQIIANPNLALHTGDPQTLQLLREIYPAWYEQHARGLTMDTARFKGPVAGQMARNITAFTGAPVNPINNAAALKRMQQSASSTKPPNSGPQGAPSGKMRTGPQSAKTSAAAAQRDDPSFSLD